MMQLKQTQNSKYVEWFVYVDYGFVSKSNIISFQTKNSIVFLQFVIN